MISTILHLTILLLFSIGILNAQTIKLTPFATGFTKPLDISNTGNKGDTRLFITEKDGKIKSFSRIEIEKKLENAFEITQQKK